MRWEYRSFRGLAAQIEHADALDKLGLEGWEAFSAMPLGVLPPNYLVLLKRPLPENPPSTPLHSTELVGWLSQRVLNILQRNGFRTLEQVIAVSAEDLRSIRGIGPSTLREIRELVRWGEEHAS